MLLVSMEQILRIRHLSLDLVEVVTRVVNWPAEKEDIRSKKKNNNWTNASRLLVHNLNSGDCWFFFLISTPT